MSGDDPLPIENADVDLTPTIIDDRVKPVDWLPHCSAQARLQGLLHLLGSPTELVRTLLEGVPVEIGALDITWRASGLGRPGAIVHLAWPRLDIRVGVGLESTLSHAIVDHLLGFPRFIAEATRQVTPVEFGVLTFLAARALDRLDAKPGPWEAWDLTIERVGPDPFNTSDLGPIVTIRFPIKIGEVQGALRLWFPESLLKHAALDEPPPTVRSRENVTVLDSVWRAEAGTITLTRGLARLKPGTVFPIDNSGLKGTVATPEGPVRLVGEYEESVATIDVHPVPETLCARVYVISPVQKGHTSSQSTPMPVQADGPVTLVVELGRVNLSLARLADLKTGDLLELSRHASEPVELTSDGKLVARGELVQIDTDLGVRVKNVLT